MHFALGLLAPDLPAKTASPLRSRMQPAPALGLAVDPERATAPRTADPLNYLAGVASGLTTALAWLVPETIVQRTARMAQRMSAHLHRPRPASLPAGLLRRSGLPGGRFLLGL